MKKLYTFLLIFTLQFSLELHDFGEEYLTYQINLAEFLTHGS